MATHNVTLIPGDGIGPELSNATVRVVEATGVSINWDIQEAGEDVIEKYGTPLPAQVLASIRKNKVAIKGPISTPIGSRLPQRQRRPTPRTRPLLLSPALQELRRRKDPLR